MTPNAGKALASLTDAVNSISPSRLDELASTMPWGTFGPDGIRPMEVRYLSDLDTDHLENILVTQKHIDFIYSKVILHLIKKRLTAKVMAKNRHKRI